MTATNYFDRLESSHAALLMELRCIVSDLKDFQEAEIEPDLDWIDQNLPDAELAVKQAQALKP